MNHTAQYTPHGKHAYRPGFRADGHSVQSHPTQPAPPPPQYLTQPPVLRMPAAPGDYSSDSDRPQTALRVNVREMSPEQRSSPSAQNQPAYPMSPTSPVQVKVSTPSPEARLAPGSTPNSATRVSRVSPGPNGSSSSVPLVVNRGSPVQPQLISFKADPVPDSVRQQAALANQDPAQPRPLPPLAMPSVSAPRGREPGNAANPANRKDFAAAHFGALGADSAKPQPQRRQYTEGEGAKPQKLDIERFEAIRRRAAAQPHDPNVQMEYAKTLAEAADILASRYTDPATPSTMHVDEKFEQRNRDSWTREALAITRKLALKVMLPEALFFLGCSYSTGTLGLELDSARAFELYTRAAKAEHPQASYRVAVCYEIGVGTRRDIDKALTWYKRAAQLGDVSSMYKLGMLALDADQIDEGLSWLLRASDLGEQSSPHALHQLGLLYEGSERANSSRRRSSSHSRRHSRSTSVGSVKSTASSTASISLPRDPAKALSFYYRAAKLGYAPSQFRLGHAYEYRELGCEVDAQKSISWYTAAAQQGDPEAELALSGWYWTGAPGVLRKSDTEAFLWAQRAADKGLGKAFFCLGHYYEYGIGVPPAPDRAKHWFSRALEQKHPKAAGRLRLLERSALSNPAEYSI